MSFSMSIVASPDEGDFGMNIKHSLEVEALQQVTLPEQMLQKMLMH